MIEAKLHDGTSLQFPDGTKPEVMQAAVKKFMATGEEPKDTSQSWGDIANAEGQNFAQGATLGFADEIGQGIAKSPLAYGAARGVNALGNLIGEGNPNPPNYEDYKKKVDDSKEQIMSPLQRFNKEHPVYGGLTQAAGGIYSMGNVAKLAGSVAPETASAIQTFAKTSPYLASSGLGAGTGAVYGAGTGDETSLGRGGNAVVQGLGGAVAGPLVALGANKLLAPVGRKAAEGVSALQDYFSAPKPSAVTAPPPPQAPISTITNEPLGAPPTPKAVGPVSMTGKLPLSPAVKAKDANMLRVEENARQGLLGNEAQTQMKASDAGVEQDARRAMQQLKGITNKDSDELLTHSVKTFQDAAKKTKDEASALYKERDEALASAVANKRMVGPSLGKSVFDFAEKPGNRASFKVPSNSAATDLLEQFRTMVTSPGHEMPMEDYVAWRKAVSDVGGANKDNQVGYLAKGIGRAADDWIENNFNGKMLLSGDPEIGTLIQKANSSWKNYKSLFGSDNSPVIEGMTKPYDATPRDFVDKVFGANISGNGNTSLNMRKMVAALPEDAQEPFKEKVFQGIVSRVFEGANGDTLRLGKLRDNLVKMRDSQVYQEHFAADKAKDTVVNNLISDLNTHIQQTGRRDVISPSGGAVMRGVKSLVSGLADIPVVGKATGMKVADTALNKVGDMSQASTDLKAFRSAMRNAANQAQTNAKQGKVFELDSLKSGITGASASSVLMNNKNKEKK